MTTYIVATACLLLSIAVSYVSAACPNYKASQGCLTGSCDDSHKGYKWKIPSNCPLLEGYGTAAFYLTGQLEEDTAIPGTKIKASIKKKFSSCCSKCKKASKCKYFQHLALGAYGGLCFTYNGENGPVCDESNTLVKTKVGAKCQNSSIQDDPHLVGAHGTHYDFSGVPNKSFCLISDRSLQINMKMSGYLDSRTESATLIKDGKAVRTWIRELGLLWFVDGQEHSLRLVARPGPETARADGFLASAEVDDVVLPRMVVGEEITQEGGLSIKFEAIEKKGAMDVDFYTVKIGDLLDMDVRLRVANPLLQTPEDAETHISIGFNYIKNTPTIHGVLGQTYRADHEERAIEFSKVAAMLHHNIAADGETGAGFLDGTPDDYITSSVMEADCRFSNYQGWAAIQSVVEAE